LLVERGLVDAYVNENMPEQSHRERQQLRPLIRAFAAESFNNQWPTSEQVAIQHTIASFYADYCLKVANKEVSEEALSYDEINIMGALEWASTQHEEMLVTKLCSGMQYFWISSLRLEDGQKYLPEGIKSAQVIAKQTKKKEDRLRLATLQQTYAQLLQKGGQAEIAKTNYDKALTYFHKVTDQKGEYKILASLGEIAQQGGDIQEAEGHYRQSLTILRALQDEQNNNRQDQQEENEDFVLYRQSEGEILTSLGELAQQRGRLREAEDYYEESLGILRETGSRESQFHNLIHLGEIAQYRSQKAEAEKHFSDALTIAQQVTDPQKKGIVFAHMAELALSLNQTRAANNHCQKALAIAREVSHHSYECQVLCCMGKIEKNRVLAEKHYKDALKIAQAIPDKRVESKIKLYLGDIALANGDIANAERYYREALAIADTFQDVIVYAELVLKLGTLLIQSEDQPDEGCEKIREAVQLYASMQLPNEREAREMSKRLGC